MKIMEVIEKNDNFKNCQSTLKLLETGFTQLGKALGSESGKNWTTFKAGDILSVDALKTLNTSQKEIASSFEAYKADFNSWVNSVSNVINLSQMTHNMAIADWANTYTAGVTPASYQQVFRDIVTAELNIREATYVYGENKLTQNLNSLKEWSKSKPYSKNVSLITSNSFGRGNAFIKEWSFSFQTDSFGVTCSLQDDRTNRNQVLFIHNPYLIPIGSTVTIRVRELIRGVSGPATSFYYTLSITNNSLTGDSSDGTLHIRHTGDNFISGYVNGLIGIASPHFSNNSPSLSWFKSRILI